MVELGGEGELVGGLLEALLDDFLAIGATTVETTRQFLDGGCLHEEAQRTVAIILLDVDAALDIDIEHDGMARGRETLDFGLQGAVELVGINLFIFEELVVLDATTELFGGEEIVIDAILLGAAQGT